MGVLAVTKSLRPVQRNTETVPERLTPLALDRSKVIGDRAVVGGHAFERLACQAPSGIGRNQAAGAVHLLGNHPIVRAVHHDHHVRVILGRRAHHRGPADIDILDRGREAGVGFFHHLLEGIKVDYYQVDRFQVMLGHLAAMRRHVAPGQDTAVDPRMQGLDSSVQDLRKSSEFADRLDLETVLIERRFGATGGQQFDPMTDQRRGKFAQAAFVCYSEQRPRNLYLVHSQSTQMTVNPHDRQAAR